jgi:hypothetical protein
VHVNTCGVCVRQPEKGSDAKLSVTVPDSHSESEELSGLLNALKIEDVCPTDGLVSTMKMWLVTHVLLPWPGCCARLHTLQLDGDAAMCYEERGVCQRRGACQSMAS